MKPTPELLSQELGRLEAADLVRPSGEGAEGEYRFKHNLIQEAAYAGLLRERRAEVHRQVAESILRVLPEAATLQPAVLALHYRHGGDDRQAFHFALRAGSLAQRNHAVEEAVVNFDLALEVAPRLPPAEFAPGIRDAFLGKGTVLEIGGRHREALQVHQELEAFARQVVNPALEAEALLRQATLAVVTSAQSVDVEPLLERAEALAREAGDELLLAKTLWNRGLRHRFRDPRRADDFFSQALEIARGPACASLPPEAGVREAEAHILIDLMVSRLTSGRRKAALQYGGEALEAFRDLGNRAMVADALAGLANLHQAGADFETSTRCSEEGQVISQSIDNPWGVAYNGWARVQVHADQGEWETALEKGNRLIGYAARVPFIGFRLALNSILARVWIDLGQPAKGAGHARAAVRLWEASASPTDEWYSWVQSLGALACLSEGDLDGAEALLEEFRDLPSGIVPGFQNYYYIGPVMAQLDLARGNLEGGVRFASGLLERLDLEETNRFSAEMRFWRGRLLAAQGAWADARRDHEQALDLLKNTGARSLQWPILAGLADAIEALGQGDDGRPRAAARAIVESLGSDLREPSLRASFFARHDVERLVG